MKESKTRLVSRARKAFMKWQGTLPTGADGMTRKDLRRLERWGIVRSGLKRINSGTLVRFWKWEGENDER